MIKIANINTFTKDRKISGASVGYNLGDYFGKRFKSTLSRNINTNSLLNNIEIKASLSEVNSDFIFKKSQIRYASTDSENSDTERVSESVNPDHKAADNWENIQDSTTECFRFMKTMGHILEDKSIESLSNRSEQLARESENLPPTTSQQEAIINERDTINAQSLLIFQAEYNLAERAQISDKWERKIYNNLQPSMRDRKDKRDKALEERLSLEQSWEQPLENNSQDQETEGNLESTTQQVEDSERNLESTTQQAEGSETKRKLDVSQEEQGESSKKQKTESQVEKSGSLIEDFADPSQEPADYFGGDD